MLALLIGSIIAAGLLARGAWDLWAQSLLFISAAVGTSAWLIGRVGLGYVPRPSRRLLVWLGLLTLFGGVATYASPLPYYALQYWRVQLLGLWIFCAVAVVSKDDRARVDQLIRAGAWVLVLLAFYQRYHDGMTRPASALLNQNVFAGALLLLLPLAAEFKDWLLFCALLVCLAWSHSVGAWLGIGCAIMITRSRRDWLRYYLGLSLAFVCLVLVWGKLRSPDALNRWHWWAAAWHMGASRPLAGFGPGSYTYAAPTFFDARLGLPALFAHDHFLELAAECGWLYALVWGGGLVYFLRRGAPHKRFGAIALLVQSLFDYPLSIPAVYWLFCYFAASTTPQGSTGVNVRYERKAAWTVVIAAAGFACCWSAARAWQADRLKALAIDAFTASRTVTVPIALLDRSVQLAADPEAERALAELLVHPAASPTAEQARLGAEHLERAAHLNPYRASTWTALERLYRSLGDEAAARRARAEGQRYCPVLLQGPA